MPALLEDRVERIWSIPRTAAGDAALSRMLRHDASVYHRLSTAQAERVRGEIFAAFAGRTLTPAVIGAIEEELRTSFSALVLAGAARAVRGSKAPPPELHDLLVQAYERLALRDERVHLGPRAAQGSRAAQTAREELAAALAAVRMATLAPHCCHAACGPTRGELAEAPVALSKRLLAKVEVEDQDGRLLPMVALLTERTSLLALFYTRCMNPAKCSLTITRLAALARYARSRPGAPLLNLFALSYDPAYDSADRLNAYGRARDFPFGEQTRLLRCRSGWAGMRAELGLRVGYGEATVNDHARELFLVSPDLEAVTLDAEILSNPERVMQLIKSAGDAQTGGLASS